MITPLAPFVDRLPLPSRLTVRMRAATHQFHRDLPSSSIWGFEGTVPGPTIEAERGQPVTVEWRNELESPFPVVDTTAPRGTDANGLPVQCFPGLSGGEPNRHAAGLTGNTVVHLHGGLTPASYDGWAENLFAPGQRAVFHYPMDQRGALLWYHDHVTRYRVVAAHFEDTTTFFPMLGEYEVWQLINLTGDTHPIHLHLDPFQILTRRPIRYEDPGGRHRRPRSRDDRHARAQHGRRARPRDRRKRMRSQGHDPRQPERDRRDRRPLQHLQRPVHVPLPHPRARGPRHDAALRHYGAGAHAVHGVTLGRRHDVATRNSGTKRYRHPVVGEMAIRFEAMRLADEDQLLFIYSVEPRTPSHDAMRLLATWAATKDAEAAHASSSDV
jgi:MmyB-like transcription regulator ligand binding domain/Multicopper oxidase